MTSEATAEAGQGVSTPTDPSPSTASDWPVGIPVPSFGIGERAGETTIVADAARPLPGTISAGDVVQIEGTYSRYDLVFCVGTAATPAFIRGAPGAQLTAGLEIAGSYCIVENLTFSGGASIGVVGGHHIALRNMDIGGTLNQERTAAVGVDSASDIVVKGLTIHDIGNWQATYDQDANGISIGSNCTRIWVLDNSITRVSGDGVTINPYPYTASNARTTHHIYVGRNTSHHNKQTGFWTKMSADVVFSQNIAYGQHPSDSHYGAGFGFQYGTERAWYLYNRVYDSTAGFGVSGDLNLGTDGLDTYFVGNVVYNLPNHGGDSSSPWSQNACFVLQGGSRRYLVNNTCHNAPAAVRVPARGQSVLLSGNIFSGIASSSAHVILENLSSTVKSNLTDVGARFVGTAGCTGCVVGNPAFTNAASGDFTLQPGSAAIDRATEESVYATYQNLHGVNIRRDAAGSARPQGAGWDIGAYERR